MPDPIGRGEVWLIDLGEPMGHEAGFTRPGLVISDERANRHGLVVVCPIGRAKRGYPTRVEIEPGTSGLHEVSYVQVEQVRTVSADRLLRRVGSADLVAITQVERALRFLLCL